MMVGPELALEFVNVLMVQINLAPPSWQEQTTPADWRALTPLLYQHVTPYVISDGGAVINPAQAWRVPAQWTKKDRLRVAA